MNDLFFPIFSEQFKELLNTLTNKRVVVIGHIRPDGDCIGSQVAMTRLLTAAGINAIAYNFHPIPINLQTFVGETVFHSDQKDLTTDFDYVITVDCSAADRMGAEYQDFFKNIDLCIDHHISNKGFAEINWIDSDAAATAEIIAGIAHDCEIEIDPITAQALFVGIATDTGQFRYAATTSRVFELAAWLVKKGAKAHGAAHELYERESEGRVHLLQHFLKTLQSELDGQLVFGKIEQRMFELTGTQREETEGFIDYARNIDTVKIAALLEQQPDGTVKGSLRSKFPEMQVNILASKFNGGGHACAAGFHSNVPFESFPEQFVKAVKEHLNQI